MRHQTAIFKSLDARKATFLLALIWIASPVAGLRPMRAARFLNLQDAETRNTNSFALLEMLCDFADEIAEEGFTGPLRQLMLLGQGRCKMLSVTGRLALAASGFAVLSELAIIDYPP